ncbi:MAG TPA: DNA recombination protein RmuC [Vicinamibacteria bacterium]|nr:DNA recombination protein RmuC [Vicinamibacteria bacterium]
MVTSLLAALCGAALGALLVLALRPGAAGRSLEEVRRGLDRLAEDVGRVSRAQELVRRDVQEGREWSVRDLNEAAQGIRGDLVETRRALAEVKALEQGRTRQLDYATDSLRRLEAIVAGSSSRGAAGESILARALGQLPPDLLELRAAFDGKVVEYALRLPGGRLLPIDSKWTSASSLERLADAEDPAERRRLEEQVAREIRGRMHEMAKYLDPARTLSFGVLAVPDAAYAAAPEVHAEGYRQGVLVVPYSLALPYVLALYRLVVRFGTAVDQDQLAARLRDLERSLGRIEEELQGRLSRGLVQIDNARGALGELLRQAQKDLSRLLVSGDVAPNAELVGVAPLDRSGPASPARVDPGLRSG